MRYIQNLHGKSLAIVALGILVIVMVIAFSGLGGNATEFTAQAFPSPISTPTPIPSPMPNPLSPPPPPGPSLAKNGVALLAFFETRSEIPYAFVRLYIHHAAGA